MEGAIERKRCIARMNAHLFLSVHLADNHPTCNTDRSSNDYAGIAVALMEYIVVIIASMSTSGKRSSGPPGAMELKGDR
jgi:hypothetical protein